MAHARASSCSVAYRAGVIVGAVDIDMVDDYERVAMEWRKGSEKWGGERG
jgi:hypothetical protein